MLPSIDSHFHNRSARSTYQVRLGSDCWSSVMMMSRPAFSLQGGMEL